MARPPPPPFDNGPDYGDRPGRPQLRRSYGPNRNDYPSDDDAIYEWRQRIRRPQPDRAYSPPPDIPYPPSDDDQHSPPPSSRRPRKRRSPDLKSHSIADSDSDNGVKVAGIRYVNVRQPSSPPPRTRTEEGEGGRASLSRRNSRPGPPPTPQSRPRSPLRAPPRPPSIPSPSGVLGDRMYHYEGLAEGEFRLLRILPATMTTIKAELFHAPLTNAPRYIAISYAWGDPGDTKKIQLHGKSVAITASLHGALEALRQRDSDVIVWADALCIDQNNFDERKQQVQRMTTIYARADHVAVWLGAEADGSKMAVDLLWAVNERAGNSDSIRRLMRSCVGQPDFPALIALYERDYWQRLWVVQEIFNGRSVIVYCGGESLPWGVLRGASVVFSKHRQEVDHYFPSVIGGKNPRVLSGRDYPYSFVLRVNGPFSIPATLNDLTNRHLLKLMSVCRNKLAADPKDKVFGLLGVMPQDVRDEFPADYSMSLKEVYTNVVDFILRTTERVDVICEARKTFNYTNPVRLPSWVPDWSDSLVSAALGRYYHFSAAGDTKAEFRFLDELRDTLEISAVYLGTIVEVGSAIGSAFTPEDIFMAFLNWRATCIGTFSRRDAPGGGDPERLRRVQEAFCRTICLDQAPPDMAQSPRQWMDVTLHVFGSLLREVLPYLELDRELAAYASMDVGVARSERRGLTDKHFGECMAGHRFCITDEFVMGMGSAALAGADIIVVPLGCSSPVILRLESTTGEYRFVGDVYMDKYMRGRAIEQARTGTRRIQKFVLR